MIYIDAYTFILASIKCEHCLCGHVHLAFCAPRNAAPPSIQPLPYPSRLAPSCCPCPWARRPVVALMTVSAMTRIWRWFGSGRGFSLPNFSSPSTVQSSVIEETWDWADWTSFVNARDFRATFLFLSRPHLPRSSFAYRFRPCTFQPLPCHIPLRCQLGPQRASDLLDWKIGDRFVQRRQLPVPTVKQEVGCYWTDTWWFFQRKVANHFVVFILGRSQKQRLLSYFCRDPPSTSSLPRPDSACRWFRGFRPWRERRVMRHDRSDLWATFGALQNADLIWWLRSRHVDPCRNSMRLWPCGISCGHGWYKSASNTLDLVPTKRNTRKLLSECSILFHFPSWPSSRISEPMSSNKTTGMVRKEYMDVHGCLYIHHYTYIS